jgi:hypothetical protein
LEEVEPELGSKSKTWGGKRRGKRREKEREKQEEEKKRREIEWRPEEDKKDQDM